MALIRMCVLLLQYFYCTPANTMVLSRLLVKLFQVLYTLNRLQTADIVCVKMPCALSDMWWVYNYLLILNSII